MPVRDEFIVGDWTVSPSLNLLTRGDDRVRVEPRVMDVLVHFAGHADRLVSKEELIEEVWKCRAVTDEVLTVTIYALRKALGDDARRPRYIETISRRGYRLMAPVRQQFQATAEHAENAWFDKLTTSAHPEPAEGCGTLRLLYSWPAVAATAAVALFSIGAVWTLTTLSTLSSGPHRRHVPPAEAHEAYVKGRYFLDQRSIAGWKQALDQFERAVAIDPDDPAAHAGLADTYSAMSDFGVASPAEMRPRAIQETERALALDPQSAEGHAALGRVQFLFDWNFAEAERSLARAVALDPDYMPAHQSTAWLESARGRHAKSIAAARRALQLDPVNIARYTELAWVLALGGHHAEALAEIDRALQLNPRSVATYLMKGWAYELAGQPDAAFSAYRDAMRISGVAEESLRTIDATYRAGGLKGYYRGWLSRRSGNTPMSETWRAQLYTRVGDLDRAIESLEQAYRKRESALAWVNVEPSFQPLRSDARFQQIAARFR